MNDEPSAPLNPYQAPESGADEALVRQSLPLRFLVSGATATGKRETTYVEATSAKDAVAVMEAGGYTDVTLHMDEVEAIAHRASSHAGRGNAPQMFTPREMVAVRFLSGWKLFSLMTRALYRKFAFLTLAMVGLLIIGWWRYQSTFWWAIVVLPVPAAIAFRTALFGTWKNYRELLYCQSWGRWKLALDRVASLRKKMPEYELDCRQACALAGLGRLDEAFAIMERYAGSNEIPRWMYLGRLSELCVIANQHDLARRHFEEALEEKPDAPTLLLGLAALLLRYQIDTPRARRLIEQAEAQPLSDLFEATLPCSKGVLALNEGVPAEAESLLRESLDRLDRMGAFNPLCDSVRDTIHGYLAITYAQLGDRAKAEEEFRIAEPRIKALGMTQVLDRYNEQMKKL